MIATSTMSNCKPHLYRRCTVKVHLFIEVLWFLVPSSTCAVVRFTLIPWFARLFQAPQILLQSTTNQPARRLRQCRGSRIWHARDSGSNATLRWTRPCWLHCRRNSSYKLRECVYAAIVPHEAHSNRSLVAI